MLRKIMTYRRDCTPETHPGPTRAGRRAANAPATRHHPQALSPFSGPFHHFPWNITGQMPQLLTSTGERAGKVVKGPLDGTASRLGDRTRVARRPTIPPSRPD